MPVKSAEIVCEAGTQSRPAQPRRRALDRAVLQEGLRYFLASALALALDFALLTALVEWAHWHPLIAASLGFAAGTLVTFVISSAWVFRQHSYSHWSAGLAVFALIGVSGLLVNLMLIWLGTEALGWDYRLAKLGAAGGSFLFNFCARKLALFNRNVGVTA